MSDVAVLYEKRLGDPRTVILCLTRVNALTHRPFYLFFAFSINFTELMF